MRSLLYKKYRNIHQAFVIEGNRILSDLIQLGDLHPSNVKLIAATVNWLNANNELIKKFQHITVTVDLNELKKLSSMITPPEVIAVVDLPQHIYKEDMLNNDLTLVLDSLRDPGNLGTIIRTADWLGIKNIICSNDCVDVFNNKVVQASMGAVMRICIYNAPLINVFKSASKQKIPVYAATTDGDDVYSVELAVPGILVFGNEAQGINVRFNNYFDRKIAIPVYKNKRQTVESLNVASAAAIICSEYRRRQLQGYSK
ncbi:MAG: RNA methyltransferase [Bacteroidales bacterium]|nr:RNA methyltransferase [Bacteroidales bacterium]